MRTVVVSVLFALLGAAAPSLIAQAPASPYVSVLGVVDKVDAAGKVLTVKPENGAPTTIKFDEKTSFLLLPAGEKDMKKATPSGAGDVATGDHVLARVLTADPTGKPARTIVIEKQSDLAKLNERQEEEWKTATSGLITSIDPAAKQIKIMAKVAGSPAPKEVTVDIGGHVDYTHYNPATGKYEPATLAAIKTGDQLRVLGDKNADSTVIKAVAVGSGSFKTIGVQVKTIDVAANQITGIETASKQPVVVALRADTSLKKFSDVAALMVARQLNPTYQQAGGRGRRGGGEGQGAPDGGGAAAAPPSGAGAGGGEGGGQGRGFGGGGARGGGRGGRGMDIGKIIEQQPAIQLADLKPNDAIIVTGATGDSPSKITATALVAGVEPILRAAPSNAPDPLAGSWNMGGAPGGEGGGQ
jgi:hypothetical protein